MISLAPRSIARVIHFSKSFVSWQALRTSSEVGNRLWASAKSIESKSPQIMWGVMSGGKRFTAPSVAITSCASEARTLAHEELKVGVLAMMQVRAGIGQC